MSMTTRLLSRLTAISVRTGTLPLLSWSFSPSSKQAEENAKEVSFVEACKDAEAVDLRAFVAAEVGARGKKVVFVGEQHEQPGCVKAGLLVLDELIKLARHGVERSENEKGKDVVLVLEHFNILQQSMLDAFSTTLSSSPSTLESLLQDQAHTPPSEQAERAAAEKLLACYADDGTEGFNLVHYMPIFLHARCHGVKILAGFPPRPWARIVSKEGIEVLKEIERLPLSQVGFDRWNDLQGSAEHRAVIKGMVTGKAPFVDSATEVETANSGLAKGLFAAQTFKDAVLAFVVDRELKKRHGDALIVVLTGSGHCEYGMGAPERLKEVRRDETCLLICKGREESGIWVGNEWGGEGGDGPGGWKCADGIVFYDEV